MPSRDADSARKVESVEHKAKLKELKRQADEIAEQFAKLMPVMRGRLADMDICISFEDVSARIAAAGPNMPSSFYLGAVRA